MLKKIIFYSLLALLWAAISNFNWLPSTVFPSPTGVLKSLVEGFTRPEFQLSIGISIRRILIGYTLAVIFGVAIGLLLARFKTLDETFGPLLVSIQALPSICWLPVVLLWFGKSELSILLVVIIGAFAYIALATNSGIKNLPPIYVKAAQTMGVNGLDLYRRVILPASLPAIISGMKMGWSFAWRSLMAAELIFITLGIGQLLQAGQKTQNINQVFAVMVIIIAIGILADQIFFSRVERIIQERWGFKVVPSKAR